MSTTAINCLIIRRSTNTNAFGLRGFWALCENSRRVFSFAANDLDAQAYKVGEFVRVPFHTTAKGEVLHPAHELAHLEGVVTKAADVPEFLGLFNDTLAGQWSAYRAAKAITAQPA